MRFEKLKPEEMAEGAGARVRRLFPVAGQTIRDPFVLFDEFFVPPGGGFPDHPHRGFEVITYVLDGAMRHKDNLGNEGIVKAGGVQRITTGSGIVHSEMPDGPETARGVQLWINLAKADKGIAASYQQVSPGDIPESKVDGYRTRTIVGPGSPVRMHTPMLYLDVELAPGSSHGTTIPEGQNGLLYVVSGEVRTSGTSARAGEALLCGAGELAVTTGPGGRYLLLSGKPHGEPVLLHGSYVD